MARAPARYHPLAAVARDGWAWEFLRRNIGYAEAWRTRDPGPDRWNLHAYVDPVATADIAPAVWKRSGYILSVSRTPAPVEHAHAFDTRDARCNLFSLRDSDTREHLLIMDEGRRLQLDVAGEVVVGRALLSPVAGKGDTSATRRHALTRALDHLILHGRLPERLYRGESGAHRLLFVLLALDGVRDGIPPQELAPMLFGPARLQHSGRGQLRALRAQISRAVARGEWLVQQGYPTLLG